MKEEIKQFCDSLTKKQLCQFDKIMTRLFWPVRGYEEPTRCSDYTITKHVRLVKEIGDFVHDYIVNKWKHNRDYFC